ncbi:MAG: flagellar biosynthesis protein FlgE [Clostridiales bacterium]|nr:MAG: flagellar biosynthesis protein FlgE [Clostridiales bacterium]
MMRSMLSGVSGLRVHQAKMDTIGNNIANVNTVGFKGSSVTFQEFFSQLVRGAGTPQGGRGGTNPQQLGLGVSMGSADVNHVSGSSQRTDKPTDLMIDGNGFFVVTNDVNYQKRFYTRAGNFTTDKLGYLVTPSGFKVLDTDFRPIRIDKILSNPATITSKVEISGNINAVDKADPVTNIAYSTSFDIFDGLGNVHSIVMDYGQKIEFNDGTNKGFLRNIKISNDNMTAPLGDLGLATFTPPTANANAIYAKFNEQGVFQGIVNNLTLDAAGHASAATDTTLTLDLVVPGTNDISIPLYDPAANPPVNSFKNLNHYVGQSDGFGKALDGNPAGTIESFNVSQAGEVMAMFTNGKKEAISTIVLATFDNNAGLLKLGTNMFVDSPNSGAPKYGKPGAGRFGTLAPGALEMSNVDLSQQFTDMITTQRGFQANSRVITTTDEMLQELVNLKR